MSRPVIADQRKALWLGVVFSVAGAALLWDAYDRRGFKKPLGLRVISLVG